MMKKIKNENQKGGVLAIILFIVIAFSILLASGNLLNKTAVSPGLEPMDASVAGPEIPAE